MNDLREKLKELREAAGLTQEELASRLGVSRKSINRYEQGKMPDAYVLQKLALFFNVSADYLLGSKAYRNSLKERKEKLKRVNGNTALYKQYLKCLNDYEIVEDATYYWIQSEDGCNGGHTMWVGWYDEEHTLEIRRLRPVQPRAAIKVCTKMFGRPMVLNCVADIMAFFVYGGQAIVREDICKKYLPNFWEDYIVPNPELKALEELKMMN